MRGVCREVQGVLRKGRERKARGWRSKMPPVEGSTL